MGRGIQAELEAESAWIPIPFRAEKRPCEPSLFDAELDVDTALKMSAQITHLIPRKQQQYKHTLNGV